MIKHGDAKPVQLVFNSPHGLTFFVRDFPADFFAAFFPTFISSCGLGFIRTSAPINAFVAPNDRSGFDMSEPVIPLFAASLTKLRRAAKFIEELKDILDRYKSSNPIKLSVDAKVEPPVLQIAWDGIPDDPEAVVGDCIHNLRTALDLMACELVRSIGGNDNRVYFPFANSAEQIDIVIKEKNFHRAGTDAVDLLKTFQPYVGGNKLLRAMHDLDIEDKHKALIVSGVKRTLEVTGSYNLDNPEAHNLTVASHDVDFAFGPDGVLAGANILQTLESLMQLVQGMLEAFASMVALRERSTS